ncbi:MAG TPA: glucose-6-phosphate dehydrogenase assembly protein OpcA [Verrucomicrobiae bacterium]|nr:glucose-6-phosphate dehydrogenase assembly protein OpcA [Verrucomicrobiae bacterium]
MAPSAQLETFTNGVETAVDVAQIEGQLHELWQLAADSEKDPMQRQITRACLFNFIVLAESDTATAHASDVISTLTSHYPCRAIVLSAGPGNASSELSASIAAHCHLAGTGQKQVCCEQIVIRASGESITHLGSAVLPLLESDLPTIMWWQGNFLTRMDLFRRLAAVADRVIYDTSVWPDPHSQLAGLLRALTEHPRCSFTDLSWTRLGLWRKLAAEFFDEPRCRAELLQIRNIDIVHGCGPGAGLRGLLCGSWFAAQLGWPLPTANARIHLSERDDGDATSVGIISIAIKTGDATFSIRKDHGERTASATVDMPCACGLPRKRAFWPDDDVSLLSQELDRPARDPVYEKALAIAVALLESDRSPIN